MTTRQKIDLMFATVRIPRALDGKMVPLPQTDEEAVDLLAVDNPELMKMLMELYIAARQEGKHPLIAFCSVARTLNLMVQMEEPA